MMNSHNQRYSRRPDTPTSGVQEGAYRADPRPTVFFREARPSPYEEDHGVEFRLWTEAAIRVQPQLRNAQQLLGHQFSPEDPEAETLISALARAGDGGSRVSTILARARGAGLSPARADSALFRMALQGLLSIDLSAALQAAVVKVSD